MQTVTSTVNGTRDYFVNIHWKEDFNSLKEKVNNAAKKVFEALKAAVYSLPIVIPFVCFVKVSVIPLALGLAVGMAYSATSVRKTAELWETIKQRPFAEMAAIVAVGLFTIPTVTIPVASFAFGARLGGYYGQNTDFSRIKDQWLQGPKAHAQPAPQPARRTVELDGVALIPRVQEDFDGVIVESVR